MVKIYLDAGHGGKDTGAVGNGLLEKDITLEVVKKIEESLKKNYTDVDVLQTRTEDIFLSLTQRTDKANKWGAAIFLSVHVNSSPNGTANGFETHIYNKGNDSKTISFQNVMHGEILNKIKGFGIQDRGKKRSDFHVLRESTMTALLSENLFISSPKDSALLKRDDYISATVEGHVIGLEKFLGLKKSQQPPDVKTETTGGTIYRVQVGAFGDKSNALDLVNKLKKEGYNPVITTTY